MEVFIKQKGRTHVKNSLLTVYSGPNSDKYGLFVFFLTIKDALKEHFS